jgi:aryl-alcohol dehydrogenase-like predicted oxidoreductase
MADAKFDNPEKLELFAKELGHTLGELAIAWLLANPCGFL